jgi:ferredoxin-NADP reductase
MSGREGAPPGVAERLVWQEAAVTSVVMQTPTVKSFFLKPPNWHSFFAGQHVDVRLSAPDGYQAQRSYSIGSAPDQGDVELVIERLDDGEVSPFFHEVVAPGDTVEMLGPIGGHFNWAAADGGPILLIGGGSGVVPLVSVLRHRAVVAPGVPMVFVYSARRWGEVIFRDELMRREKEDPNFSLALTLTREPAPMPGQRTGRIDRAFIAEILARFGGAAPRRTYVCGATAFVEVASMFLVDAGLPFASIRTERYGGSPAGELSQSTVAPEV